MGIKTLGLYNWYHGLLVGFGRGSWEWIAEHDVFYKNDMSLEGDGLRIGGKISGEEANAW